MKIKKDTYFDNRGGHSKIIELSCAGCNKKLGPYQKDDPSPITGTLKRLYLDRCGHGLQKNIPLYKSGGRWDCPKCNRYLDFFALYKKEKRKAIYLLIESISYIEK